MDRYSMKLLLASIVLFAVSIYLFVTAPTPDTSNALQKMILKEPERHRYLEYKAVEYIPGEKVITITNGLYRDLGKKFVFTKTIALLNTQVSPEDIKWVFNAEPLFMKLYSVSPVSTTTGTGVEEFFFTEYSHIIENAEIGVVTLTGTTVATIPLTYSSEGRTVIITVMYSKNRLSEAIVTDIRNENTTYGLFKFD